MTSMCVVSRAPGQFGIEVTEGTQITGHTVRVPEAFLDDLLLEGVFSDFPAELQRRLS